MGSGVTIILGQGTPYFLLEFLASPVARLLLLFLYQSLIFLVSPWSAFWALSRLHLASFTAGHDTHNSYSKREVILCGQLSPSRDGTKGPWLTIRHIGSGSLHLWLSPAYTWESSKCLSMAVRRKRTKSWRRHGLPLLPSGDFLESVSQGTAAIRFTFWEDYSDWKYDLNCVNLGSVALSL